MNLFDRFEQSVRELAEDLASIPFFSRVIRSRDHEASSRRVHRDRSQPLARIFVGVIIASIFAFFCQRIGYYFDWLSAIAEDPRVVDLTSAKQTWDVHYGSSPSCAGVECYLTENYPAEKFEKKMVLPAREFPLEDYRSRQIIYLRTTLYIPSQLRDLNEPLAIQSLYVWAERYDLYINGRLVTQGGAETLFVTIPSDLIPSSGRVFIAMRIDPGKLPYQGLANQTDLLIGPKKLLAKAAFQATEIKTTYYLWFLIPKLIFCLIFSILFVAVARHAEVLFFVLYGYASAWAIYVNTDYRIGIFGSLTKPYVADVAYSCLAEFLLLGFVYTYFRRSSRTLVRAYKVLGLSLFALLAAYLFSPQVQKVFQQEEILDIVREILRSSALLYGTLEGAMTVIYLGKQYKSRFRLLSCSAMGVFFAASLLLSIDHYIGSHWRGFYGIKALIFDLVLFNALASVVAIEFGLSVTQRNFLKNAFGRFVDPTLVDRMIFKQQDLAPQRRKITVMFADIRSFTEICQVYPAAEVHEMLREYRDVMVKIIKESGGYVDKFVGDAIMAFWGAPVPETKHAEIAMRTGLAMRKELAVLNERRRSRAQFEIAIGMGFAIGEAIVGEIDGTEKTEYTALGEVVNLAARIEGFTKELKTDILFSEDLYREIADISLVVCHPAIRLKGVKDPVSLYQLVGAFGARGLECNFEAWDAQYGALNAPATLDRVEGNLRVISYFEAKQRNDEKTTALQESPNKARLAEESKEISSKEKKSA